MVTFLKGRRRNDDAVVAVDANGANIAATLEALVARAETAAEQLRSLAPVLERSAELDVLRERCVAVEEQVAGLDRFREQLAAAVEQAGKVAETKGAVEQIEGRLESLDEKVERALAFRAQLDVFLGEESPLGALRGDSETLRTQLAELAENVTRMRAQHDDALTAHRHTTARLEGFAEDHQAAAGRLEEVERRVQAVARALEPVDQAVTAVPDLQHRLAVLKSLADQVGQKTAMLEQQREAVDRAATQISQLTRLDRELDAWLRRQEEQMRRFGQIEAKIAEVQAVQSKIIARSDELQQMSQQTEEAQQAARQSLTDLREQMRKSSEGFELENRGLHAVSERIADLRNAVKECEARFAVLDAASQGATAVQAQVRGLGEEAAELTGTLARLSQDAGHMGTLRQEIERVDAVTAHVKERMERINQVKPDVDEAVQHLVALKGTRELMADGLEQMRLAYEEMTRLREAHGETQTWLASTDTWTRKVQAEVKDLSAMEPAVERMRAEVDQVKAAMSDIEARRGVVDEVHHRLADLGSLSGELKDRADTLRTRMEAAEARFIQLGRQAEEAQRVSDSVAATNASVGEAERRLTAVDGSVRGLESRIQQLDEMEERIRILGQELEQRQGALDKATEHLTQASALRQQAAETAHRLEEVNRSVGATLTQAEERAGGLKLVTGELETRAGALKSIDRQLGQFEELLGQWESAQSEAARALEQTLARQAAVEALEAQVRHVFGLAERAVADVQAIGSARREVEETRTLLEETQTQFKATEQALQGFETRKRQLERAEQRLARAEALALGVRSTVETLQAQRTVVDHAVESAGALAFQMKQAEALIGALRRERTLACELKAAIGAVDDEDESPVESDAKD
jgi:chromosome segregation ATPase